jgi:2-polyprenyl-6-methoxyphenol hydroxylase-like FAD-dependent oxidoreductase
VARFADGTSARGACLIGADGIHSAVRAQVLGPEPPRYAGYTCCRGIVAYQSGWFPPGWFVQGLGDGARYGLTHTGRDRVYWWATFNAPEGSTDAPGGRKRELLDRYAGWAPPIGAVLAATDEAAILRNDIVDRPSVAPWGVGPVTLLGDAAHPMTPNMAQGACQAVEDAIVLANCLAAAGAAEPALRAYEARRQERTALVVAQSWLIGARGQGLLSEAEARQAMQLADREAVLRYVAA